jgi:molybdopterin-synthase adenylyltransferase
MSIYQTIKLQVDAVRWSQLCDEMRQQRNSHEETLGFVFCKRKRVSKKSIHFIPEIVEVPSRNDFEMISSHGLELKQAYHRHMIDEYLRKGYDMLHVHTHPGLSQPQFSGTDNHYEDQYSRFLCHLDEQPRLFLSCVMNEDFKLPAFRFWHPVLHRPWGDLSFELKSAQPVETKSMVSAPLLDPEDAFRRQEVFGEGFQRKLSGLRVALIGCGGIGAVFAEQLSRLGVKNWVLMDPDRIEAVNLNRLPASTQGDADQKRLKVDYTEALIRKFWNHSAEVVKEPSGISKDLDPSILAGCDWVVTATDNHASRMCAQEWANTVGARLLSLGTHIDVLAKSTPRMFSRVTLLPEDKSWCLVCGSVIDPNQVAREEADLDMKNRLSRAGYLDGVPAPAVYWLNSMAASLGVGLIHRELLGLVPEEGVDWVLDYGGAKWIDRSHKGGCYNCDLGSV